MNDHRTGTSARRGRLAVLATLTVALVLAAGAPAVNAATACPARSLQSSIDNLDSTTEPTAGGWVFPGARIGIGTRCKAGRAGQTYSARVCVRYPNSLVRCRTVLTRSGRWSTFVVTVGSAGKTYRVSWSQRAGSTIVLRRMFRTYGGFEPPDSGM